MRRVNKLISSLAVAGLFALGSCTLDPTVPEIVQITPSNEETLVSPTTSVEIHFSLPMEKNRTESAFSLTTSGSRVEGDFKWKERTLTFTPKDSLKPGARYILEVTTEAVTEKGSRLGKKLLIWFESGQSGTYPTATLRSPASSVVDAARPVIEITFSREMNEDKVEENFALSPDPGGTFEWADAKTLRYLLRADLAYLSEYRVKIAKAACDSQGYGLAKDFVAYFTYGTPSTPPVFLGTYRLGDATLPIQTRYFTSYQNGVSKFSDLVFHFSREMSLSSFQDGFSINPSLEGRYEKVDDGEGHKILFYPNGDFEIGKTYRITLSGEIKDTGNFKIGKESSVSFVVNAADSVAPTLSSLVDSSARTWNSSDINTFAFAASTIDLTLTFTPSLGAGMEATSVQDNLSIYRFAGVGGSGSEGTIKSYSWNGGSTVLSLSLASLARSNYYRLRLAGGTSGAMDSHTNRMTQDAVYLFYFQ